MIPPGQISGQALIEITNDRLEEPDETLIVTLGTPVNATLGATTQLTVTIQANDVTYQQYLPLAR